VTGDENCPISLIIRSTLRQRISREEHAIHKRKSCYSRVEQAEAVSATNCFLLFVLCMKVRRVEQNITTTMETATKKLETSV